jgi:murein L,D-transpeptidase YcbB/YkuD
MFGDFLRRLPLAAAFAFGLAGPALAQAEIPQEPASSGPQEPTSIAPPAATAVETLLFSTEAAQPKPMLAAEDMAIAEQLREAIANDLYRHIPRKEDRAGVEAFYRSRDFAPLWFAKGTPLPRAKEAIAFLHGVDADGLEPADYPTPLFADFSPFRAASDELLLTNAVLTFARHAGTGRVAFTRVSGAIYFDLKFPQPAEVLGKIEKAAEVRAALDSFNPQHAGYRALKAALAAERGQADDAEKITRVPDGPLLRPGAQDERVPILRQRLKLATQDSLAYDDELVEAVKSFQAKNNLKADGIVGAGTVARLNGQSRTSRVGTIIANMERWRWLPRELGTSYVIVNVPDYTLKVVDRGGTIWSTRIVVGKPGTHATPLLTETMKFITVNPTWNVPPSIIRNEYLPALQRDPNALARIGLKVSRNGDGSLRVYQPPGARNALGRLRFNFPNRFLVYQHDTPDKHLFDKAERAYSHGCMRVQHPERYAEVLLGVSQPQDGFTAARIQALYGDGERTIKFDKPIPVYVTYQTAFVDEAGRLQTRPDLYGHDKAIAGLLGDDDRQNADTPVARDYHSSSKPVMASVRSRNEFRTSSRDDWGMSYARGWGDQFPPGGGIRQTDRHRMW